MSRSWADNPTAPMRHLRVQKAVIAIQENMIAHMKTNLQRIQHLAKRRPNHLRLLHNHDCLAGMKSTSTRPWAMHSSETGASLASTAKDGRTYI